MFNMFNVLLFAATVSTVYSLCNYVHNYDSNTVYATDVCMHMSETSHFYSKFICEKEDLNGVTESYPYIKTYPNSQCNESQVAASFRMDDTIMGNLSFSYDCDANISGCYVEYIDNCFNSSDSTHVSIFTPINTCIEDETGSYAFEFLCDINGMTYKEYTSMVCDSRKLRLTKNISDCTLISDEESLTGQNRYFEVCCILLCSLFLFTYC